MRARSERGQMTIEMMLLLLGLFGGAYALSRTAQEQKWMQSLVSGPWKPMQGMIEDGAWVAQDSKSYHPSIKKWHGSYRADPVP